MTRTSKILSFVAAIFALPTGLLHAQSLPVAKFTTQFPFYVLNQKMPAGSYTVSRPNSNADILLIRDADSSHSGFVLFNPTRSIEPVEQGEVTFHQYGDADYLSGLTLSGEETGMQIPESATEKSVALAEQGIASTKSVALQGSVPGY